MPGSVAVTSGGGSYDKFRLDNALELAYGVDQFADLSADALNGYHYGRTVVFQGESAHPEDAGGGGIHDFGQFCFNAGICQVAQDAYGTDDHT